MAECDGGESTEVDNNKGFAGEVAWNPNSNVLLYLRRVFGSESGPEHIKTLTHDRINTLEQAMDEVTLGSTPFGRAIYHTAESVYNQSR